MGQFRRSARLVVAVLAVSVGCGDGAASPPDPPDAVVAPHRVAVDPDAALPPGSEVAGSLIVQEGSHLISTAFPRFGSNGDVDGWQAFLTVDGDPVEVWERYRDALGGPEAASAANSCTVTRMEPGAEATDGMAEAPPAVRLLAQEPIEGENRLECRTSFGRTEMALMYGTGPKHAHRGCWVGDEPVRKCSSVSAHLRISTRDSGPEVDAAPSVAEVPRQQALAAHLAAGNPLPAEPLPSVPMPTGPVVPLAFEPDSSLSRLPLAGDAFDDHLDHSLHDGRDGKFPPNEVPSGGRSLMAPVLFTNGPCIPGTTAIMSVPGTPEEAFEPFLASELLDTSHRYPEGTNDQGRRWIFHGLSTASGYYLDLLLLDAGEGRTTVLATNCTD